MRLLEALGYPLVDSLSIWNSGLPMDALQPLSLVHNQIAAITSAFVADRVRALTVKVEDFDCRIEEGAENSAAERIGDLTLREDHLQVLRLERFKWAQQLASLIAATVCFTNSKYSEFSPTGKSINRQGCC